MNHKTFLNADTWVYTATRRLIHLSTILYVGLGDDDDFIYFVPLDEGYYIIDENNELLATEPLEYLEHLKNAIEIHLNHSGFAQTTETYELMKLSTKHTLRVLDMLIAPLNNNV